MDILTFLSVNLDGCDLDIDKNYSYFVLEANLDDIVLEIYEVTLS